MGGILQVDTIQNNNATTLITQTNSTTLTFGVSGQNIVIPSGVTFNTASATVTLPTTIKVDTIQNTNSTNLITQTNVTTITFGATSQTISVPSVAKFNSTIGVGNATPSTSGAGITFPATQSASTDANTLDDYEEGTWTPIDSSGAGLTFTNTSNNAYYTKIGDMVYASFRLTYPSTANGSNAIVGGLPFTSSGSMGVNTQPICFSEQNLDASAMGIMNTSASNFLILTTNGTTVSVKTNANCSSKDFRGMAIYKI